MCGGFCGGAKANVPFVRRPKNIKIFARGQSPDRKHRVFMLWFNNHWCRIAFCQSVNNCHVVNDLPITVCNMASGGLRNAFLSAETKAQSGLQRSILLPPSPFAILRVVCSDSYTLINFFCSSSFLYIGRTTWY